MLEAEETKSGESLALFQPQSAAGKYDDDPDAFNAKLAKLMGRLKKEIGALNIQQNYKGTGSKKHRRQLYVRLPFHPRGGPDVWLDSGYVQIGGVIDVPKSLGPMRKKYENEEPEAIYAWIRDSLKAVIDYEKAHAASSAAKVESTCADILRLTKSISR